MISSLDRMVVAQQRLISDISHELRTPLTRLQLATALMRRRHGEGKELERIEMEAQRLDSMINDLLVLSRSQHKMNYTANPLKLMSFGPMCWRMHSSRLNKWVNAGSHGTSGHGPYFVILRPLTVRWRISCVTHCVTPIIILRWHSA